MRATPPHPQRVFMQQRRWATSRSRTIVSSPVSPDGPPAALLRGGASHEAEGRGGRAGRVGPPATRRRLCVVRQIGDKLSPGVEQFLLVDDVVTVEDGADQVAGGGAAVEPQTPSSRVLRATAESAAPDDPAGAAAGTTAAPGAAGAEPHLGPRLHDRDALRPAADPYSALSTAY